MTAASGPGQSAPSVRPAAPGARRAIPVEHEDSLDLLSAAGRATVKRVLPLLVGAAVVVGVIIWFAVK